MSDAGHCTPSMYQVWRSQAFWFRRYGWFSVTALRGLVTLTFDLSTSEWGHWSPVSRASFLSIYSLSTHGHEQDGQTDRQDDRLQNDLYCVEWDVKLYYTIPDGWTDRRTDKTTASTLNAPTLWRWRHNNWSVACINWVSRKKWIWENRHWSCEHANGYNSTKFWPS